LRILRHLREITREFDICSGNFTKFISYSPNFICNFSPFPYILTTITLFLILGIMSQEISMQKKTYKRPTLRTFGALKEVTLMMDTGAYKDAQPSMFMNMP